MRLSQIYKDAKKPVISYEVFPPKGENTKEKIEALECELKVLQKYNPALVSVTYGAGGSNRENSLEIVKIVKNKLKLNVMPHFTCVCTNKNFIQTYLKEIETLDIVNILALRGDEPIDIDCPKGDFDYAWKLIEFIKQKADLDIAAAGYPEKHPRAKSFDDDLANLKKKIRCGASTVFTQLFFENDNFFRYLELLEKKEINVPIVPGILPVISFSQLHKMAQMSGVILKDKTVSYFEKYKDSKEDTIKAGVEFASAQIQELFDNGIKGIHFYTLNKAKSTEQIINNLFSSVNA